MATVRLRSIACAFLVLAFGCRTARTVRPEERDRGYAHLEVVGTRSSSPEKSLPNEIKYNVTFDGGKRQQLWLKKQGTLSELPVYVVGLNGVVSKHNFTSHGGQDVAFYLDKKARAAITLSIPKTSGQRYHDMRGTFYHNHALYSISNGRGSGLDLSTFAGALGKSRSDGHRVYHVIMRHANSDNVVSHGDDRKVRSVDEARQESEAVDLWAAEAHALHGLRKRRQAKTSYTVDMMYINDYYMYQRVQAWMAGTGLPSSPNDVAREVAIILATAANQVKLIYDMINTPTWSLTTNLAAMYIVTSPEQSSWEYAYNSTANSKGVLTIHSASVLSAFTTYLNTSGFPRADHTVLITGFDMYSVSNRIYKYDDVGIANLGKACTPSGTAVVEMVSLTLTGQIVAHELGHSLNAQHDGFLNTCNASYGFVMAPSQPSPTAPYYDQFSNCSITAIGQYIAQKQVCLTTNMAPYNLSSLEPTSSVPIGMRYTAHDQCRMRFGTNYKASGGATMGQQLCYKLWCYESKKNYSFWLAAGRALDGTPCGNSKWCVQGLCVYNSSAPAGSDTCPLGNQPPYIPIYTNSPLTCSTLQPKDCYDQRAEDACCATCGSLYNSSWPSCAYGDRRGDCTGSWVYNCNTPSWYTNCCKFCESNKLSIPSCPYGDSYGDCGTSTRPCDKYAAECCKTCANYSGK